MVSTVWTNDPDAFTVVRSVCAGIGQVESGVVVHSRFFVSTEDYE